MADKEDYLTEYRRFFEDFAANVNPDDQLPVRIASYEITHSELTGEILTWTIEYLNQKQCPSGLLIPLCRIVLQEMRDVLSKEPNEYGCQMSRYKLEENVFKSLQLMKAVTARANTVCLRYLDNSKLDLLPPPPTLRLPKTSVCAIKNYRNRMEDRHTVIDNLNALFAIEDTEPTGFYAVYDGHSGSTAASYAAAHLHQYLAESRHFLTDPRKALIEAFVKTDDEFVRKRHEQNNNCGTTAAVVIIRGTRLHAAWVGDSQALLVSRGRVLPLVTPHKPDREDEKKRIEQHEEGFVLHACGAWRVCGRLAVSRAIGDPIYKPFVSGTPDVETVALDGEEDFVVVATDGLWDVLSEDEVALTVYRHVVSNPDDLSGVSSTLCDLARRRYSSDNISAVVVLLQPPHLLAARSHPYLDNYNHMELGASVENGSGGAGGKPAVSLSARLAELGPESAVDAADEELLSPALAAARALVAGDDADADPQPVHDGSALVDNVGESGEDSEDEWNYYKGDQTKEKEIDELQREQEEADLSESQDSANQPSEDIDMNTSPLNPEAAPFVPVSPTRPAFGQEAVAQRLLHDELIAESPRKPLPMDDIDVPDRNEFDNEAFKRPAELVGDFEYSNGHGDGMIENIKDKINGNEKQEFGLCDDGAKLLASSASFDDHPLHQEDFERVQKDTMGFGDIQVAFAQTEGYINPIDSNIDEELFERLKSKERDPMSMSFYQEKDEDTCETGYLNSNPFDLNAVHDLPADSDEELISSEPHENGMGKNSNPFSNNATSQKDVSSSEIIAAITDLDNVVHHETDPSDQRESHSPFLDPAVHSRGVSPIGTQSPLSDNVSQLTEPSEEDHRVQATSPLEAPPSDGDSALSRDISSPVPCPLKIDSNADPSVEVATPSVQEPLILSQSPLPESQDALLNFSNEFVCKHEENSTCESSEVEPRQNVNEFDTFSSELKDFTLQSVDIVPESDKLLFEEIPEVPKDKLDLLQYDDVSQKLSEPEIESEGTTEMGEEISDVPADLEIISGIGDLKVTEDHIVDNEFKVGVGKEIHDDYLAQENIDALIQNIPEERSKDEFLVESLEGCDQIVNQVSDVKDILIMSNEESNKNEILTDKINSTYGEIESDLKNVNLEGNYIPNVESEFLQSEKAVPDFEFDENQKAVESTLSTENLPNEDIPAVIQHSEYVCSFADSTLPADEYVSPTDDQDSPADKQISPAVEDIAHLEEPILCVEKPEDELVLPTDESPIDKTIEESSLREDEQILPKTEIAEEVLPKTESDLPTTNFETHDTETELSVQEILPPSDSGLQITEADTSTVEKLEIESFEKETLTPEVISLPHIETSKDLIVEDPLKNHTEVVNEPLEVDLVADICQSKAQEICEPITQEIDNQIDQIIENTETVASLCNDVNVEEEAEKLDSVAADIFQSQGDILQQNSLTNGTVDLLACSIPHAVDNKMEEVTEEVVEQMKNEFVEASPALINDAAAPQQLDSLKIESGTPPPTPAVEIPEPETLASSPPPSELVQAMEKLAPVVDIEPQDDDKAIAAAAISAAAVGAVAVAAGAAVVDKKLTAKPKTPASASKKLGTATKSPSSPTKSSTKQTGTVTPKTPVSAAAKKPVAGVSRTPLSAAKPSSATPKPKTPLTARPSPKPTTTASPASRPKPASAPSSAKPAEKKPLTNGDAKPSAKRLTIGATKPAAAAKPAAARPATVPPSKPATTRAPLSSRTAPTKTASATVPTSKPKPAPATTARPASARSVPTAKAPPAKPILDKQVKDLANKQLSTKPAPRTIQSKSTTSESKTGATKTTLTKTTSKTTTTTTTTMMKKPLGASKPAASKTTTKTTKTVSAKLPVQNGPPAPIRKKVVEVAPAANGDVEMNGTHLITDDDTPRKDDSPQQVDNSMLPLAVD